LQNILEDGKKERSKEVKDTTVNAQKMTLAALSEQRLLWKSPFILAARKLTDGHRRGEHVINNGVLKVYRNIREKFIETAH
jgi:hypothetical protein